MKKTITFFLAGVAIAALGTACDNSGSPGVTEGPRTENCWVFVNKTPGEETILLAHSGLTLEESDVIRDEYKSIYGEDNITSCGHTPPIGNASREGLDCYEYTVTYEFTEQRHVPTVERIYNLGYGGVRIDGRIATCKWFFWAFTEKDALEFASQMAEARYWIPMGPSSSYDSDRNPMIGKLVGSVKTERLGPEVRDVPITF